MFRPKDVCISLCWFQSIWSTTSQSRKITFIVSQPIFQSSMCRLHYVSCCIIKVSNLVDPCTNNFLFYLIQNSALNTFQQIWIYHTHTHFWNIELYASIIFPTTTPGLISFSSSRLTCFIPTRSESIYLFVLYVKSIMRMGERCWTTWRNLDDSKMYLEWWLCPHKMFTSKHNGHHPKAFQQLLHFISWFFYCPVVSSTHSVHFLDI